MFVELNNITTNIKQHLDYKIIYITTIFTRYKTKTREYLSRGSPGDVFMNNKLKLINSIMTILVLAILETAIKIF